MTDKLLTHHEVVTRGGEATKKKYGSKHFSEISKQGHKKRKKADPGFYDRLQKAGNETRAKNLYAKELAVQTEIAADLGESLFPVKLNKLSKFLLGRK